MTLAGAGGTRWTATAAAGRAAIGGTGRMSRTGATLRP
jgi:hypothetical protein